ncbi:beta-L-arabinofuranosidase domain-containing protein [uncultured Pedobacter sp.]|uniref:beta-L-arabinofuranosidase domain-containing protein n=1 Tax=uncultured Pedobacter sp. TaxID=246139 RepID=UPI0025DE86A4|nr:beta-L-arabinofuranosidase domain-containing protein [uncultured Pedobacter sp.]
MRSLLSIKVHQVFRCAIPYLAMLILAGNTTMAQNGDQILDGIGETAMSARYEFKGDLKDWSRNRFNANFIGAEPQFVQDSRFGKVLSLSGTTGTYVNMPDGALADVESISITAWVLLQGERAEQSFLDFGQNAEKHFSAQFNTKQNDKGFLAMIQNGKQSNIAAAAAPALKQWVHLAIVVDIPSKSLTSYLNGKKVAEAKDINFDLTAIFGQHKSDKKSLILGNAISSKTKGLDALIHDFRIYRVALNAKQIVSVYQHGQNQTNETAVNTSAKTDDDLQHFPTDAPQLYTKYLIQVNNIEVTTTVGDLPRLPGAIAGTYQPGKTGPMVKVIWPNPTDNSAVSQPGNYTITGYVPGTSFKPKAVVTVTGNNSLTPDMKLQPFALHQVTLKTDHEGHETKFMENRDKFIRVLAKTDPNSFLYMFRHAFGQKQPAGAKPLGVWDSEDTKLRGHATGHYLSAIAQAYAGAGGDKAMQKIFADKMDYMVNTLYSLSQLSGKPQKAGGAAVADPLAIPYGPGKAAYDSDISEKGIRRDYWNWGKGFISAYPPDQFIMLENGAKYGGQNNQIWAPYYTLHKILAGLLDVYEVSGNKKALEMAGNMGDWVYIRLNALPQQTLTRMWNTYIAGEFGGMNESMAHLYRITGKEKYLKTAQLFDNIRLFYGDAAHTSGLAKNVDLFRGLHANQHIPQIVGSMELYRVSQQSDYFKIADNFWHKVVNNYMYSIGGVAGARNPANAECFIAQPGSLYENGFSEGGQNETCATYNMLKLTGDLFLFEQKAELMDYYERALYNDILASVAKDNPGNTYHISLRPGVAKQFSNDDMTGFTCCNGTALESSTKLQNSIYFKDQQNQSLYVNLFIPSVLNWSERKIKVEQTTSYPKSDQTSLKINGTGQFDLYVRVPGWATKGFVVKINGQQQKLNAVPGTYLKISRDWKSGDQVDLTMPFQFHLDPVMDQQNIASLFYGPILLAAQEPEARKDWRKVVLNADDLGKTIKGDPSRLEFTIDGVLFKPFYDSYGRHSVYLDVTLK